MSHTFSMFFWQIKAKMTESQHFSMFFQKYLCFLLHKFLKTHRKMLGHSQIQKIFALIFHRKVWDIEKVQDITKFRKNQGKNNRVPTFFYVKVFRWTPKIYCIIIWNFRVMTLSLCQKLKISNKAGMEEERTSNILKIIRY